MTENFALYAKYDLAIEGAERLAQYYQGTCDTMFAEYKKLLGSPAEEYSEEYAKDLIYGLEQDARYGVLYEQQRMRLEEIAEYYIDIMDDAEKCLFYLYAIAVDGYVPGGERMRDVNEHHKIYSE